MRTIILIILCALSLAGCNDKPTVQNAYDFSLSSWHLQSAAKPGEQIEIRFYLTRDGDFRDADYRFGYIQTEGAGRVFNIKRIIYTSREEYPLRAVPGLDTSDPHRWVYTLYYRYSGPDKSALRFFVIDNFGGERTLEVEFNPDTSRTGEQ